MKKYLSVFIVLILMFNSLRTLAQLNGDTLMNYYFNLAKTKMDSKRFSEANDVFKKIFSLKTPAPDELAYYYGFNLLQLNKFAQSRTALNKYLELQGTNGPFSKAALEALEIADCKETGYRDIYMLCDICYGDSAISVSCRHCKEKGFELCPLCKGNGVSMSTGNFGTTFQTCPRCNGEKIVKCTVCKGTLKEKIICYSCNGKGRKKIRRKCTN